MPTDEQVVEMAAEAAEGLVFSRLQNSVVDDLDITVSFEDGVLDVDVYLNAPDADADLDTIADDAALAAQGAVDDLFADEN
jgi:fructose 1,6-bisphosphatase